MKMIKNKEHNDSVFLKEEARAVEAARWVPPLKELQRSGVNQHGWIIIKPVGWPSTTWEIINWHSFDDLGQTIETLTIQSGEVQKEIYSLDEGETFTFELQEA
jgi:hypothetical protein